jgi:hypothetical protein
MSVSDEQRELRVRQTEVGERIKQILEAALVGTDMAHAAGGLLMATAFLLTRWADPGREAALLISGSDYLANSAANYPVERPR